MLGIPLLEEVCWFLGLLFFWIRFLSFLVSKFLGFNVVLVSWFLGLKVCWFLGFVVSDCLGFSVSKRQSFKHICNVLLEDDFPHYKLSISYFSIHIDLIANVSKNLLDGSS